MKFLVILPLLFLSSIPIQKTAAETAQSRSPAGSCKLQYMNCTFACQDDQACWAECSAQYDACLGLGTFE